MNQEDYSASYSNTYALVIGINDYQHAPPLGYAINDATAASEILANDFGFDGNNIILLTDKNATKVRIMDSFLSYTHITDINDRILFFFAGHGHTVLGHRGEVGFLIPNDGDSQNLSTLIRWDELTRNADLIPAKHVLFVMDACYGGLVLSRSLPPGSMRFLKDMLLRYSRQVLTAGKADEVVADSGGPIPGHSIFTGHFIEALKGKAASDDGVITANGVMAYVYDRVAKDERSHQTPHYGFFDGDGDFIFRAPIFKEDVKEEKKDEDVLISVPSTMPMTNIDKPQNAVDLTKEYLSDTRYNIKLDDLVTQKLREVLLLTSEDNFPVQATDWSVEEFKNRLNKYQQIIDDLLRISCCIAYWGTREHSPILKRSLSRLTDRLESKSGLIVWQALRWYPVLLLLYSTGISALASDKYDNLSTILLTKVGSSRYDMAATELALAIGQPILELNRAEAFKHLPGHETHYVPRSEYLFKLLQPILDDLLFLGSDYEHYFDRFEVLLALVHTDLMQTGPDTRIWGPIGRFAWKYRSEGTNPLRQIIYEGERHKDSWEPIVAGLFGGNYSHFQDIATAYEKVIAGLNWG
jgi:hypothetical protein